VELALINALAKRYPNAKALDPASAAPILADYEERSGAVQRGSGRADVVCRVTLKGNFIWHGDPLQTAGLYFSSINTLAMAFVNCASGDL
jgi:hypothetical protein